jgi:glycosyltransferase involved in cell wall biosynthesis
LNLVYVYGRDWPSEKAGLSFSTYTGYGIAQNEDTNVDMIFAKNTEQDSEKILVDYFGIKPLKNFKIHLMDNKTAFSETTKFYFQAFNKIRKLNKLKGVDVIISRTVKFLPFMYLLKKIYNIKVIYEAHSFYLDPELKDESDNKKEYIYQKYFLPKIDGIICHQTPIKKLYQKYLPNQKYSTITYGIKQLQRKDNIWKNQYIGYVGSLYDNKGVSDLFKAFRNLDTDLKLLIIGGRKKRINKFLDLAKELNIEDRVKITGWVDRSKVDFYLKSVKIGVVPVQDTFHGRYLTCPTKIFNYFSHGIPIVGSDLPTVKEVVTEDCGVFYKNGNVKELESALKKVLSSKEDFYRYSNNIMNRSQKLFFKNRGKKFIDFIKRVS